MPHSDVGYKKQVAEFVRKSAKHGRVPDAKHGCAPLGGENEQGHDQNSMFDTEDLLDFVGPTPAHLMGG